MKIVATIYGILFVGGIAYILLHGYNEIRGFICITSGIAYYGENILNLLRKNNV